jgi:large subunit ribosomal protein L18
MKINKNNRTQNRANRVSLRLQERSDLPKLLVKRSNLNLHAQVIARDGKGTVLAAGSTTGLKDFKGTKVEASKALGVKLADLLTKNKVGAIVLDRAQYKFHGRIKSLVESLREKGIKI